MINHLEKKRNTEQANKAIVLRLYDECFNQGKFDVIDEIIAPGCISPGPGGGRGPDAYKTVAAGLRSAFPDIHFTIHDLVAEADRVVLLWTWEGTHRGPFMNIPPTGKQVRQDAMVLYQLADGKVVEVKIQNDRLGFLQQLGLIPEISGIVAAARQSKT